MTIRKLILAFRSGGSLAAIGAAPAPADPVFIKLMPAAACDNPGTRNAHQSIPPGMPGHPHLPQRMGPQMTRMTMPGLNPGQT